MTRAAEGKLRLGVSACLLGEPVRYDGRDRREVAVTEALAPWVEFVAVCPEVELGLGVPRPPIELVGPADRPRLVEPSSGRDLTDAMAHYAAARVEALAAAGLDGYLLKSRSPSCGPGGVARRPDGGDAAEPDGVGRFAAVLVRRLPELPVADERRLAEPVDRAAFVERMRAYRRARLADQPL